MQKHVPFTQDQVLALGESYPTPYYIYDEAGIRSAARALTSAFSWSEGFKEYFAVKATPNPHILKILKEEGCGADCSSLAELELSTMAGITGEDIMLTSNDTPLEEFARAKELGALINLDAPEHLEYIEESIGLPEFISLRYNPGPLREGNSIIGKPEEAKFGMTLDQLMSCYRRAKEKGVTRFGLHTMVASNERTETYFIETARMLFDIVVKVEKELHISIELVNLGGGIGIPYRPDDIAADVQVIGLGIQALYAEYGFKNLRLAMECGRYITGPHGYLITTVRHLKETYRRYAGVDATMANLMRPGMYGAYHHISVLGKENAAQDTVYDVVGSLCENNDKFAIARSLPMLEIDDVLVIHDAGAHGHAMGFNYNGKLRSAELLMREGGAFQFIRRAETLEDHFATLVR